MRIVRNYHAPQMTSGKMTWRWVLETRSRCPRFEIPLKNLAVK